MVEEEKHNGKEMYTFSDFCIDREILSKESADDPRHLRVMWDVHGDDYIDYCRITIWSLSACHEALDHPTSSRHPRHQLNNISLVSAGENKGAVQMAGRWLIPEESLDEIKVYPEKKNKRYNPS